MQNLFKVAEALGVTVGYIADYGLQPHEDEQIKMETGEEDSPEVIECLRKARIVLKSDNESMSAALHSNVIAFHEAVMNKHEFEEDRRRFEDTTKEQNDRIAAIEKKIGGNPGERKPGLEEAI